MTWQDYLYTAGIALTIVFVIIAIYPFAQVFGDNSTRKDWGGEDGKRKYCEKIQYETIIYPNGTADMKVRNITYLCPRSA